MFTQFIFIPTASILSLKNVKNKTIKCCSNGAEMREMEKRKNWQLMRIVR